MGWMRTGDGTHYARRTAITYVKAARIRERRKEGSEQMAVIA